MEKFHGFRVDSQGVAEEIGSQPEPLIATRPRRKDSILLPSADKPGRVCVRTLSWPHRAPESKNYDSQDYDVRYEFIDCANGVALLFDEAGHYTLLDPKDEAATQAQYYIDNTGRIIDPGSGTHIQIPGVDESSPIDISTLYIYKLVENEKRGNN